MNCLIDTNILSEMRKLRSDRCNAGVKNWYEATLLEKRSLYVSWISIGELYAGVFQCRRRKDNQQAGALETLLRGLEGDYRDLLLPVSEDRIRIWSTILWPRDQHPIDNLIAATALLYQLPIVTRNVDGYANLGVTLTNPFNR